MNFVIDYHRINLTNEPIEKNSLPEKCGCYIITHIVNNYVEKYMGVSENINYRFNRHKNKNVLYGRINNEVYIRSTQSGTSINICT